MNQQAIIALERELELHFAKYWKLIKTREENPSYLNYTSAPVGHWIHGKTRVYFRELSRAISKLSACAYPAFRLQSEYRKLLVQAVGGWTNSADNGYWTMHVIPENISVTPEGERVRCYWDTNTTYTLLLDWGWNDDFFLKKTCENWGHEKCSYKISGVTRDQYEVVLVLLSEGLLSSNYQYAYSQIDTLLTKGVFIDANWYEEDE